MISSMSDLSEDQLKFIRLGISIPNSISMNRLFGEDNYAGNIKSIDHHWYIENGLINIKVDFHSPIKTRIISRHTNSTNNFLGLQFGTIQGDFSANNLELTSLKGGPIKVEGKMSVVHNKLTSLKYSPTYIGKAYDFSGNLIESLQGYPYMGHSENISCHSNTLSFVLIMNIIDHMKRKKLPFELVLSIIWDYTKENEGWELTSQDKALLKKYLPEDYQELADAHRYGII